MAGARRLGRPIKRFVGKWVRENIVSVGSCKETVGDNKKRAVGR